MLQGRSSPRELSSCCSGDADASGVAQQEGVLADEHEQYRASRTRERVVGETGSAGPDGTLGRLLLPAAAESSADDSEGVNTRNLRMRTRMSGAVGPKANYLRLPDWAQWFYS